MPITSLRHHFPTLGDLHREALQHMVQTELQEAQLAADAEGDPQTRLEHMLTSWVGRSTDEARPSWSLWLEYFRATIDDPVLAASAHDVDENWLRALRRAIDDGVQSGQFHPVASTEDIARTLLSLTDGFGIAHVCRVLPDNGTGAPDQVLRVARQLLNPTTRG